MLRTASGRNFFARIEQRGAPFGDRFAAFEHEGAAELFQVVEHGDVRVEGGRDRPLAAEAVALRRVERGDGDGADGIHARRDGDAQRVVDMPARL